MERRFNARNNLARTIVQVDAVRALTCAEELVNPCLRPAASDEVQVRVTVRAAGAPGSRVGCIAAMVAPLIKSAAIVALTLGACVVVLAHCSNSTAGVHSRV